MKINVFLQMMKDKAFLLSTKYQLSGKVDLQLRSQRLRSINQITVQRCSENNILDALSLVQNKLGEYDVSIAKLVDGNSVRLRPPLGRMRLSQARYTISIHIRPTTMTTGSKCPKSKEAHTIFRSAGLIMILKRRMF